MTLSETARRWLLWTGVVAVIFALRIGCLIYERSRPLSKSRVAQRVIEKDHLVAVPKFQVNDFQSARQLIGKTLWVKLGYAVEYYALQRSGGRTLKAPALQFKPVEKLLVSDVIEKPIPAARDKEVLLLFDREGIKYATSVGRYDANMQSYQMLLDELFYVKDPHELYEHWGEEVWKKVERHELEPGMTVTQVGLSLGYGSLVTLQAGGIQLYEFTRKPGGEIGKTRVRFLDGRVKEFELR